MQYDIVLRKVKHFTESKMFYRKDKVLQLKEKESLYF